MLGSLWGGGVGWCRYTMSRTVPELKDFITPEQPAPEPLGQQPPANSDAPITAGVKSNEDIGDESKGGATGERREVLHAQVVVCGRFHTMVLLDDAQAQRWVLSLFVCGA